MNRPLFRLAVVLVSIGCSDPSTPVDPGPTPTGPAPAIEATVQFGDPPVEGAVYLLPGDATAGWTYAIDLDEDGKVDQEGLLERRIGFDYRFDELGTHQVVVELTGPSGTETRSVPVVANRPDAIRVVAEMMIKTSGSGSHLFEGIVITDDGSKLYAGDFGGGMIHEIDARTFLPTARIDLWYGLEGLTISPSGRFLFAAFKFDGAVRFELPGLRPDIVDEEYGWFGFYAYALDERRVLTGGGVSLKIHDVVAAEEVRNLPDLGGHFAVHPDGNRLVASRYGGETSTLELVSVPELAVVRTYALPPGVYVDRLAYGPSAERLHAIAYDIEEGVSVRSRYLILDLASGTIERNLTLDDAGCGLCVANPVALSREGRYLAFETRPGVLIVDTTTGLPLARGPRGSVAASPVEDATFWTLRSDGRLRKIVVEP